MPDLAMDHGHQPLEIRRRRHQLRHVAVRDNTSVETCEMTGTYRSRTGLRGWWRERCVRYVGRLRWWAPEGSWSACLPRSLQHIGLPVAQSTHAMTRRDRADS